MVWQTTNIFFYLFLFVGIYPKAISIQHWQRDKFGTFHIPCNRYDFARLVDVVEHMLALKKLFDDMTVKCHDDMVMLSRLGPTTPPSYMNKTKPSFISPVRLPWISFLFLSFYCTYCFDLESSPSPFVMFYIILLLPFYHFLLLVYYSQVQISLYFIQ